MRTSDDRKHVMLTERIERDIAHENVEMTDLADGAVHDVFRPLFVAGEKVRVRTNETFGRIEQALTIWIVTNPSDERAGGSLGLIARRLFDALGLGDTIYARRKRLYDGIHDDPDLPIRPLDNGRLTSVFLHYGDRPGPDERPQKSSAEGTPTRVGAFRLSLATTKSTWGSHPFDAHPQDRKACVDRYLVADQGKIQAVLTAYHCSKPSPTALSIGTYL